MSNVLSSTQIPGLSEGKELAQLYAQDGGIISPTAQVIASSGTITTSGPPQIGVARLNPAGNVTNIILAKGLVAGQTVWVVNESANTVTFDVNSTSNVADGSSDVIQANQARLYVWDNLANAGAGYWYSTPQIINTVALTASVAAAAIATSGTVTTANVQVARQNPGSAVTNCIMQAGTSSGQLCFVTNEAAVANTIQFDVSATSNVADGVNSVIPGLSTRAFVWDPSLGSGGMWVDTAQTVGGTMDLAMSTTAVALTTSGTVTTAGLGFSRLNPGSAVTACILGSGTINGQIVIVSNEAAVANTVTFAASATSLVADGVNCVIPGLQARLFCWNGSKWFEPSPLVGGALAGIMSATAVAIAASGTVTTAGIGFSRLNPGSAITNCIMGSGTYNGQICIVSNEAALANTIQFDVSATSLVADGVNCVIPGLAARLFCWNGTKWFELSTLVDGKSNPIASATAAALATSGTVATAGIGVSRVNPTAAVSLCVLAPGTVIGQKVTVVNENGTGANSILFAASATSNVAEGTSSAAISGLWAAEFCWNGTDWYRAH